MTAFDTRAVHAGHDPAQHNGSVTTPIYQVSTFVRPHAQAREAVRDARRSGGELPPRERHRPVDERGAIGEPAAIL